MAALCAKDLMTPDPVIVRPEDSFTRLAHLFNLHRVSGLPVVDGSGRLVGVVSKTDLIRGEWEGTGARTSDFFSLPGDAGGAFEFSGPGTVQEIMSPPVITVEEDATAGEVAGLMSSQRVHRVLVTRQGKLVGIISTMDMLRLVAK